LSALEIVPIWVTERTGFFVLSRRGKKGSRDFRKKGVFPPREKRVELLFFCEGGKKEKAPPILIREKEEHFMEEGA